MWYSVRTTGIKNRVRRGLLFSHLKRLWLISIFALNTSGVVLLTISVGSTPVSFVQFF